MNGKNVFIILLWIGLSMCYLEKTSAQNIHDTNQSKKSAADIAWEKIPQLVPPSYAGCPLPSEFPTEEELKIQREFSMKAMMSVEAYRLKLRGWGLDFWGKYPDDPRRFKWLIKTIKEPPLYFNDGIYEGVQAYFEENYTFPLNIESRKNWEENYKNMRDELMRSTHSTEDDRMKLIEAEVTDVMILRWRDVRERKKLDLKTWTKKLLDFAPYYYKKKLPNRVDVLIQSSNFIFQFANDYQLDYTDLKDFAQTLSASDFSPLKKFALQKLSLLALRESPLKLRQTATDGREVDLDNMSGKLVLLDFWATSCSSCIEKMPEIRNVYEKYRIEGFEVISICLNPEKDKDHVQDIHKRVGAKWPLLIIGGKGSNNVIGGLGREICDQYGFMSVPQLLLIKDGVLLRYQGDLLVKGQLERIVRDSLKLKGVSINN